MTTKVGWAPSLTAAIKQAEKLHGELIDFQADLNGTKVTCQIGKAPRKRLLFEEYAKGWRWKPVNASIRSYG